jgi:hypothetical protein
MAKTKIVRTDNQTTKNETTDKAPIISWVTETILAGGKKITHYLIVRGKKMDNE